MENHEKFYSTIYRSLPVLFWTEDSRQLLYPGKWDVTVVGTPQGEPWLIVYYGRKDGKLTGKIVDQATNTRSVPFPTSTSRKIGYFLSSMHKAIPYLCSWKEKDRTVLPAWWICLMPPFADRKIDYVDIAFSGQNNMGSVLMRRGG